MAVFVGVDFSGDRTQWAPNAQTSNVWVATADFTNQGVRLIDLRRVQALQGGGRPFKRLADWLATNEYVAAAIDAPFSVPWWCFGGDRITSHAALLAAVNGVQLHPGSDFPTGHAFIEAVTIAIPYTFSKPLRSTETYWRGRAVNIRSTLWNGARPGAPFASACTKLLATVNRPMWPWTPPDGARYLVEAFPAAQLCQWGLPFNAYNGPNGGPNRNAVCADLQANRGLTIASKSLLALIQQDADALDAVLCCYAGRAVAEQHLALPLPPFTGWELEGWIAVHD